MQWIVYILECVDQTLYTGITTDMSRRMEAHAAGTGAKYTLGRGPFVLRYTERHGTRSAALKREATIKSLNRSGKLRLIAGAPGQDPGEDTITTKTTGMSRRVARPSVSGNSTSAHTRDSSGT